MAVDIFASFDSSPYLASPQLPLQTLVVLVNALSTRMPGQAPAYVKEAEDQMRTTANESEKAMVIRLRETNEATLALDLALDNGLDGLWSLSRERLRGWSRYERPGLDFLLDDPELEIDFEAVREKAARASELVTRMFGEGSIEMLSRSYPEQSQLMSNLLQLIDTDGLGDDLSDLAGDELLPILRRCQKQYEAMVDRRSDDEPASRTDLRILRGKLQRHIVGYTTLVLTMMKEDKPETRTLVETALAPMITLRPERSGSSTAADKAPVEVGDAELANEPEPNDA